MAELALRAVTKTFGTMPVLHGIDLEIRSGEFVAFVGPSGCGKSTLLRCIAGLEEITSGTFQIDGRVMNKVAPAERGIAMVFQSYALYPHMTVFENMAFGLQVAGLPRAEIAARVAQAAERLQLTPYLKRYPKALSGGQRQRVAIGRAITRQAGVFLFDEPLSNLDAALRASTRVELAALKKSLPGTTMIYVTHDQVEAMTLADRIVVLRAGRIEQVGRPVELYRQPANLFVAGFIGSPAMNIFPVGFQGQEAVLKGGLRLATGLDLPGPEGHLGLRPEDLVLSEAGCLSGQVRLIEHLGEVQLLHMTGAVDFIAKVSGQVRIAEGQTCRFDPAPGALHLFDAQGQSVTHPCGFMPKRAFERG